MPAHLIEDRSLDRKDAPIRPIGRVRSIEDFESLLVIADIGERAAIGPEDSHVLGIVQGGLLEHRNSLGALAIAPQRLGIIDGSLRIAGICAIAFPPTIRRASPIRFSWRGRSHG